MNILDRRVYFQADLNTYELDVEEANRSELFSSEKMNYHGFVLAKSHKLLIKKAKDKLLSRLDNNEKIILEVRKLLVECIRSGKTITPAAEWLLDNFYLIEEQFVIAREHLPKGYSEGLPYLSMGSSSGMPRAYDIVLDIISHSDGRIDIINLKKFIESYQTYTVLSLGELWAIPIMLRLAVLENLRRLSVIIAIEMLDHNLADYWADRILDTVRHESENLILTIGELARSKPCLSKSFVAQFVKLLKGKGNALALALNWMEQQLVRLSLESNQMVQQDNQKQAADQVGVSNSIRTLRLLGATDWRDFVESLSDVERILRTDRTGVYSEMDFKTRDSYRHSIEEISKRSRLSESAVTEIAMSLAEKATDEDDRENHVGFYLIDKGRILTEDAAEFSKSLFRSIGFLARKVSLFLYLSSILVTSGLLTYKLIQMIEIPFQENWLLFSFAGMISFGGFSQLSVSIINWIYTIAVQPKILPRMDFSRAIPTEFRTLVIVPTIISNIDYVVDLINSLEIRFLANREDNIHFALITDFKDANAEHLVDDQAILAEVINGIHSLNEKYKHDSYDRFFLFHRSRKWNPIEKLWMGYERKRGKITDVNNFILNRTSDAFSLIVGKSEILHSVKYIITLDSDTQLPHESAWKFIATMAHPLNRPVFDPIKKRVIHGYGILQPRVGACIPKTTSQYLRIFSTIAGIDPYSQASSDVYQDLFENGSYIGKGIYDVAVFHLAMEGTFGENKILSHDLIEGCYAKSGYISDVLVYEDDPLSYMADLKRKRRWIRGDWQISGWVFPWIKNSRDHIILNPLSILSRWKILDNLRRSLMPISLLSLLLLGWFVVPNSLLWTIAAVMINLFAVLAATGWQVIHKPRDLSLRKHIGEIAISLKEVFLRFIFSLAVLPYEAYSFTSSVLLTWYRMSFSQKNLLEWDTVQNVQKHRQESLIDIYKIMWISPFVAIAALIYLLQSTPWTLLVSGPFLILWFFAPSFIHYVSKPIIKYKLSLSKSEINFLTKLSLKTWMFFERYVNEEENYLPPDNYQEHPIGIIAHRTSPTNLGISLLASLSAYDFGYISLGRLVERTYKSLDSMNQLERYRGHFYNWYNTLTREILNPRYISTVDSGNLVGHLLTLKQGLISLGNEPMFRKENFQGLMTVCDTIEEEGSSYETNILSPYKLILEDSLRLDSYSLIEINQIFEKLFTYEKQYILELDRMKIVSAKWFTILINQSEQMRNEFNTAFKWIVNLPVPEKYQNLYNFYNILSYSEILEAYKTVERELEKNEFNRLQSEDSKWLVNLFANLSLSRDYVVGIQKRITDSIWLCEDFSLIEYDFVFNPTTHLLSIGYNVDEQRKDNGDYDLLASEARLAIYIGIAQGILPQDSWFSLGRLLTDSGQEPTLLSWSGSMFEYLMPLLIMPSYENTILDKTCLSVVNSQIQYAKRRDVPWGISESGYNLFDANQNYQYKAFGIPGLGLKRGLEKDLVIAPYASMLALMINPIDSIKNLKVLSDCGFMGEYGFYEAIDYTKSRLIRGLKHSIIQSYMVHHQGMGLLSLAHVLLEQPMQKRFLSDLSLKASVLLLQEKIPRSTVFYAHTADTLEPINRGEEIPLRIVSTPNTKTPEIQLLSNGSLQVMISNSGGGYSRWRGIALSRWREDAIKDNHGIFCYIKDVNSGKIWSNMHQPTLVDCDNYYVNFSQGRVSFAREDYGIETKTEVIISAEDDVEMRRVNITNRTQKARVLDITSYSEVVIATQSSDEAHPSFSNLFVQTEIIPRESAIFATRRQRSSKDSPPHVFHLMNSYGVEILSVSYETDRRNFIGRERTVANPRCMEVDLLSGTSGAVLDPIFSIRYRILVKPFETATIDLIYGVTDEKNACYSLMHKYQDKYLKNRAFEISWTHSQVLLRQINVTETEAQHYDMLAGSIIYSNAHMRSDPSIIQNNFRHQSALWSHSISGVLPIVLCRVQDTKNIEFVRKLLQAHAYWRIKGLYVDLVIWNEEHGIYRKSLTEELIGLMAKEVGTDIDKKYGNIFIKTADQFSIEDRILIQSVARIVLYDNKGSIANQLNSIVLEQPYPILSRSKPISLESSLLKISLPNDLLFFNGIGGFTSNGQEYKILTTFNKTTPTPWVNVIANPEFGTVVSESGSSYTWALNAHEYRITPWTNDPISDIGGEAFYLRDEETGHFWSPTPFPIRGENPYITTHGFGYTEFEHQEKNIETIMTVSVDKLLPIKFVKIKILNKTGREKKLSITGYLEIIMGDSRSKTNPHILSEFDQFTDSLLFRNRYGGDFSERVSFFKMLNKFSSFTCDRNEFIGRNKNLSNPQALSLKKLSGKVGAAIDACGAIQTKIDLIDGEEIEIIFIMGNAKNLQTTQMIIKQFSHASDVDNSMIDMKNFWKEKLGKMSIETPDLATNVLANGWLGYQTISCRLFARSGFYQSGGAFGFRDQLQDVLSIMSIDTKLARDQLLLASSRQFKEGDVQHWWHPPLGRGVRTRCSDDLLWLPLVLCEYLSNTGDYNILNESSHFIESRKLFNGEDSFYDLPTTSKQSATLYDHAVLAISKSLVFGRRGLPLIGSGDWNDGMDQVGIEGKGESVWLGFFLYSVLTRFAEVADLQKDIMFAKQCRSQALILQNNLEQYGWDGKWYKRAFFDDGSPIGSIASEECKIDSISQSWSVLSGAGNPDRQILSMKSLSEQLVRRDLELVLLLNPPFDKTALNPGYIKGYIPGVRENGGQYTHSAIWAMMAFAKLKDHKHTWELLNMINPINHSIDEPSVAIYKVEPYVMAADIYANESHEGRGGWTWYTGSSALMHSFIFGSLVGAVKRGESLEFNPCFPKEWDSIKLNYTFGNSKYRITIKQSQNEDEKNWILDGNSGEGNKIILIDDGLEHEASVVA